MVIWQISIIFKRQSIYTIKKSKLMSTIKPLHTNLVYGLSLLYLIMGVLGYLDMKNFTDAGYNTNDFKVTKVDAEGPAAQAGMQVGDQLLTINGLDVRDSKAWNEVPRRKVGEVREYVVDRNGEEVTYSVTIAAQSQKDSMLNRIGWTIGLIFLLMGLWAFRSKNNWASFLFFMFALGFSGTFMGGPYIENELLDDLIDTARFSLLLLGFAFLVDFLLHFPKQSSFLSSANANRKIYGPAVLLVIFFFVIELMDPNSSSGLNAFIQYLMLAYIVIYFGWALLTVFRIHKNASAEEKANGVSLMFWGTILGLLPILISVIFNNLMPTANLPGNDYLFITMALIPICFALAINRYPVSTT